MTPPGSSKAKHVTLMPFMVGTWSAAIVAGSATLQQPPATQEFNTLIKGALETRKSRNSRKNRQNDSSSDDTGYPSRQYPAPQIHYVQLPPQVPTDASIAAPAPEPRPTHVQNISAITMNEPRRRRNSSPTGSPQKTKVLVLIAASSIGQFAASDYNESGLLVFLTWCGDKYGDTEFIEAYGPLNEHKMGIDLLSEQDITPDMLSIKCGVKFGTALRILKSIPVWLQTIES